MSSYVIIFLHHFYQAAIVIKISNLLICFCSFDLSCPLLEFFFYLTFFCCIVLLNSVHFNLVCFAEIVHVLLFELQ